MITTLEWNESLNFDQIDRATLSKKVQLVIVSENIIFVNLPQWFLQGHDLSIVNVTDKEPSLEDLAICFDLSFLSFVYYGKTVFAALGTVIDSAIFPQSFFLLRRCNYATPLFPNCKFIQTDNFYGLSMKTVQSLAPRVEEISGDRIELPAKVIFPKLRKLRCESFRINAKHAPHLIDFANLRSYPWHLPEGKRVATSFSPAWQFASEREFAWEATFAVRRLVFLCLMRYIKQKDIIRLIVQMIMPWDVKLDKEEEKLAKFRDAFAKQHSRGLTAKEYYTVQTEWVDYTHKLRKCLHKLKSFIDDGEIAKEDEFFEMVQKDLSLKRAKLDEESFSQVSPDERDRLLKEALSFLAQ